MARTNDTNPEKNEFKEKRNQWWIWTIVGVAVIFILLMVFGKTSILVADDQQPTTMDPAPMNDVGEDEDDDKTLKEEQEYDPASSQNRD